MAAWTADDILGGAKVSDEEHARRWNEAMADPETVSLVVVGRNGQKVEWRIKSHERTHLSIAQGFEQEKPPEHRYEFPHELWAPRWKRFTWEIEQRFDFRPEDFMVPKKESV